MVSIPLSQCLVENTYFDVINLVCNTSSFNKVQIKQNPLLVIQEDKDVMNTISYLLFQMHLIYLVF